MASLRMSPVEENLKLELDHRIAKLCSQRKLAAQTLKAKIEMRLNRIPKRYWNMTQREIRELASASAKPHLRPAQKSAVRTASAETTKSTESDVSDGPKSRRVVSPIKLTRRVISAIAANQKKSALPKPTASPRRVLRSRLIHK